mgnify:CR=1 FL=1
MGDVWYLPVIELSVCAQLLDINCADVRHNPVSLFDVLFVQGMGGQMDYFGLWIDSNFNHGHSKAKPKCTTYGSPQLSAEPEFEVDVIEVWALGPEKREEGDSDEEGEKTVSSEESCNKH